MFNEDDTDSESCGQTLDSTVSLSWENVTVYGDQKQDYFGKRIAKKLFGISGANDRPNKILDSVTGHAVGGNLVAIMGPSGGGKTTLLASLARRVELSSGSVKVNGRNVSRETMSKIAGYMPQFYPLPSALTTMEYMTFTCALRLDKEASPKDRSVLAVNIFSELGLLESRDTFISKLSGGEVKRLALAVEMVTKPKILFLDEPTTGLDTWTAMRVIESAKTAARTGTLVFCSIHQPAMDLYKMFSHVIFLSNGKTAYCGTLANATKFFNGEGFICPESFNEAEYYVKIISNANLSDSLNATDSYLVSGYSAQICSSFSRSTYREKPKVSRRHNRSVEFKSEVRKPNQLVQFYWLMWRISIEIRRAVIQATTHHYAFLMSAILVAIFYLRVNSRTQAGIQDMRGALYMISSEVIYSSAYSVLYELPKEMPLYQRENSMYNPGVYYIATVIGLIPKTAFHALAYTTIMFFSLDLKNDFVTYLELATCVIVATIASTAYGVVVSSWIKNPNIATTIMSPIDMIASIMSGIFYNIRAMPAYLSWIRYLSFFYYTNEALAVIHWTTVDSIECYEDKDLPCFRNGREILAEYGYDDNLWINASGLFLLTLVMHILGYFGVKRRRAVKAMY